MRRIIPPIVIISLVMLACNVSTSVTPTTVSQPPAATLPQEIIPSVVPTETILIPTELPVVQTNTKCNQLAIYLDPALASSSTCETIPESSGGMETYPEYTRLTLQGYLLTGKFFKPSISILPIQRFSELLPELIPGQVTTLNGLVNGGIPSDKELPLLPTLNAAQMFHASYQVLPFTTGNGIRYLTLLAQYYAPINNHELFFTYQGITEDGKYWVSATLPINNPILPDDATNPPDGQSWDQFTNNYAKYIADLTVQLKSLDPGSFTPSLTLLDALVSSITIEP